MSDNNNTDYNSLSTFIGEHKLLAYFIIGLVFIFILFAGYLIFNERFSERAKMMSETNKNITESMHKNVKSISTVPEIVKAFSSIVSDKVTSEMIKQSDSMNKKIENSLRIFEEKLATNIEEIKRTREERQKTLIALQKMQYENNQTLKLIQEEKGELKELFPELYVYKVQYSKNMEALVLKLSQSSKWDDGINQLLQIDSLIASSKNNHIKFPAKYLELVGDWCRKKNQPFYAKKYYKEGLLRDPDNLSIEIEYHSLLVEYEYTSRAESLKVLQKIIIGKKITLSQIKRIFNVYNEIDDYKELLNVTKKLISLPQYQNNKEALATFYRNNSYADKKLKGYLSEEAWGNIQKAMKLMPNDENILKIYVNNLLDDRGDYKKALIYAKQLIALDSTDVNYYIYLAKIYIKFNKYERADKVLDYGKEYITTTRMLIKWKNVKKTIPNVNILKVFDEPQVELEFRENRGDNDN